MIEPLARRVRGSATAEILKASANLAPRADIAQR